MITIGPKICSPWPGLQIDLTEEIRLLPREITCIRGANGSGKTSFLRYVLIPLIITDPQNVVLYIPQDFEVVIYTIRARTLSAHGDPVFVNTITEALKHMTEAYLEELSPDQRLHIILDEPEQYMDLKEWLLQFEPLSPTVCFISHQPHPWQGEYRTLHFQSSCCDGRVYTRVYYD